MKTIQVSEKDYKALIGIGDPARVVRDLIKDYGHELVQPAHIVMDLQPAKNRASHTQNQWIALYNSQRGEFHGRRMITSSDVIKAPEIAPEALPSLQKDCLDYWVVTSTHISYRPNALAGDITHNYQSAVVRPRMISLDVIPVLQGVSAREVVRISAGRLYLRALANDRYATESRLLQRLADLSQKEPENIFLYTPYQGLRASNPESAVWFGDISAGFNIDGGNIFGDGSGHSRGVLVSPLSGRA
jgi:hypothetical protein